MCYNNSAFNFEKVFIIITFMLIIKEIRKRRCKKTPEISQHPTK